MLIVSQLNNNTVNTPQLNNVEVCKFPYGAEAGVTQNTDTFAAMSIPAEMWGLKHNIKLHCFDKAYSQVRKDAYLMGGVDFGVYFNSCQLDVELNPLNYVGGFVDDIANVRDGKKPSTLSYGCGKVSYSETIKPYFLGGRNSGYGNNIDGEIIYDNNIVHSDIISKNSTTRFGYYTPLVGGGNISGTEAEGLAHVTSQIDRALLNNGWYTDFAHWHWLDDSMHLNTHLENIRNSIGVNNIFSGSYNEMVEYLYVRSSITNVNLSNNIINISYSQNINTADYDLINMPLYIRVDLSGTSLQGKYIKTSGGNNILSLGNNEYIIEVLLDYTNSTKQITLLEDLNDNSYISLNNPIVNIVGNNITSDQHIKVTLFSKDNAEEEYNVVIDERILILNNNHTLTTVLSGTRDYYLGYINEYGKSGLISL